MWVRVVWVGGLGLLKKWENFVVLWGLGEDFEGEARGFGEGGRIGGD